MLSIKNFIAFIILTFLLCSCASDADTIRNETKSWSVQKLYTEANSALAKRNYNRAIKLYQVLEATYPYGNYAQQGLLDLAYAYYQSDKQEMALPTIDQFIATYPTSPNMDYALYLKGYVNYKNDNGLLANFTGQDLSERDPKGLDEAYKAFYALATTYPNSKYAPDAKIKINYLVNALARGELYRARYYMGINAYMAAISRSQNVILNYANTIYVEEALAIQTLAYQRLNQPELSASVQKVLAVNFPKSSYIRHQWKNKEMAWYAFWR